MLARQQDGGDAVGRGGSEELPCLLQTCPPSVPAAQHGTGDVSLVRNAPSCRNRSGPSGFGWDRGTPPRSCAVQPAIDSKLGGCDLVKLRVVDVFAATQVKERASIIQNKTGRPVRFEITKGTRRSLARWRAEPLMIGSERLWPGRIREPVHISTRQSARLWRSRVSSIGLEPSSYGTHSMRRTKVAQIYRNTGNLRAVQRLLGHTKLDSTVRNLGVGLENEKHVGEIESASSECDARAQLAQTGIPQVAPETRQITSPTSSAISSDFPSGPSVTPTGRP